MFSISVTIVWARCPQSWGLASSAAAFRSGRASSTALTAATISAGFDVKLHKQFLYRSGLFDSLRIANAVE